ncbi:MAG: hypothetical protein FWG08_01050 [Propionibacteriaceae bacterium]|nr:hypothetical protein [Propionibacteriaceae bacterium]
MDLVVFADESEDVDDDVEVDFEESDPEESADFSDELLADDEVADAEEEEVRLVLEDFFESVA